MEETSVDDDEVWMFTWEDAVVIHLRCIRYGVSESAKDSAEKEILRLARDYDNLTITGLAKGGPVAKDPL